MDAQYIRNLQEAYNQVYQVDEAEKWIQKAIEKPGALSKQLGVPEDENIPAEKLAAAAKKGGKLGKRARLAMTLKGFHREEIDLYDVVFSHLLDEGYAETEEAAAAIMVNMSEEWRESIMIAEGMTMKDFKANRQKNKRKSASADAVKRGHVGKEWYNSGRRYSPDEAKRSRANLDDEERRTRHRSSVDPDNENDDNFSADKTKNPKKLRKQKAMGELG